MPCIAIGPDEEEEDEDATGEDEEFANCPDQETSVLSCVSSAELQSSDTVEASCWRNKLVVFLEIDGVLNKTPNVNMVVIEKACCINLKRLLKQSQAEIVLTTKWRRHSQYIAEVLSNLDAFPAHLKDRSDLEKAPWHANRQRRDLEILQWIGSHRDIAGWVALDTRDLCLQASAQRMEGHTVRINTLDGLTGNDVDRALEILGCSTQKHSSHDGGYKAPSSKAGVNSSSSSYAVSEGPVIEIQTGGLIVADMQSSSFVPVDPSQQEPEMVTQSTARCQSLHAMQKGFSGKVDSQLSMEGDSMAKAADPCNLEGCRTLQDLLNILPVYTGEGAGKDPQLPSVPEDDIEPKDAVIQFPRCDESRDEYEAALQAARHKFGS